MRRNRNREPREDALQKLDRELPLFRLWDWTFSFMADALPLNDFAKFHGLFLRRRYRYVPVKTDEFRARLLRSGLLGYLTRFLAREVKTRASARVVKTLLGRPRSGGGWVSE
jgi:hypothetical protein